MVLNDYRMDAVWYLLQEMKSSVGNNYRFHNLLEVAKIVNLLLSASDIYQVKR